MKKEYRGEIGDRIESNSYGWYTILEKKDGYSVINFVIGLKVDTKILPLN